MIFQPQICTILLNFMIIKAIAYAQSFQVMYVSLFVTMEFVILVKKKKKEMKFPCWESMGEEPGCGVFTLLPLGPLASPQ